MRWKLLILLLVPLSLWGQVKPPVRPYVQPPFRVDHGSVVESPAAYDTTDFYIDAISGSDANTGTHPDTAWQTISKVSGESFDPGDTINFDGTFRPLAEWDITNIGEDGNPIVFMELPGGTARILGSDTVTNWTSIGDTIWWAYKAALDTFPSGRLYIELVDTVVWGILETEATHPSLDTLYEYYFNLDTIKLRWNSATSPQTATTSVEIPQINNIIEFQTGADSSEYVVIDGFEIAYSMNYGIRSEWPGGITGNTRALKGFEVRNCHVHHINIKDSDGFGIELLGSNIIIEDNELNDAGRRNISLNYSGTYRTALTDSIFIRDNYLHTGWHTTAMDLINEHETNIIRNVYFQRNFVTDWPSVSGASHQIFIDAQASASGNQIYNIYIENNIFNYPKGTSIRIDDVDSVYIYSNTFYGANENAANYTAFIRAIDSYSQSNYVVIKNNIFDSDKSSFFFVSSASGGHAANWDVDYNLYFSETLSDDKLADIIYYNLDGEWADWKSTTGWDANSPNPADPDLNTSFSYPFTYDDWRPNAGSDAIDAGTPILSEDYFEYIRNNPPELGAVEIQ